MRPQGKCDGQYLVEKVGKCVNINGDTIHSITNKSDCIKR